jgi:carbonic anhydrase/acetyltransferase-like protein (isoleucine patch superfamily)
MAIYRLGAKVPEIAKTAFVADNAVVIGDVGLGERCSVWFGAVIRGDNAPIRIGAASNVQDGAILHGSPSCGLMIGSGVTVGHGAKLHGCTIGDHSLIGIGAVILDRAVVGRESLVAAGAVLTAGKEYPPRSLIVGQPAVVKRELNEAEVARLEANGARYVRDAATYLETLERLV